MTEQAQIILCRSREECRRAARLFPRHECIYTNGSLDPETVSGRKVVAFGYELAARAAEHALEVKVIVDPIPDDLTPSNALGWARSRAMLFYAGRSEEAEHPAQSLAERVAAEGLPPHCPPPSPAAGNVRADTPAPPPHDIPRRADEAIERLKAEIAQEEPVEHRGWVPPSEITWPRPHDWWSGGDLPQLQEGMLPAPVLPFALDQSEIIGGDSAQMAVNIPAVCAAAIREQIGLQMLPGNDRWIERARLWAVVVGDPATKKGPMLDACVRHFVAKDIERRKANEEALAEYELELKRYHAAEAAWIKESQKSFSAAKPVPPERPLSTRLWTDDATLQSLGKILSHHATGKITLIKDELANWFGSFDQFTNAKDADRAAYLSAYEGKPRYIDRVDGGRAYYVPTWSIGIIGGIQPQVVAKIAQRLGEDGMLARFIVAVSRPATEGEDRAPDRAAILQWERVIDNLLALQAGQEPVRFDPDAQDLRRIAAKWIHDAMRSGMPSPIVSALGKWEGLFGRLALTFHCIEAAARGLMTPDPYVSFTTAMQAWTLMRNLLWPHLFDFYTSAIGGRERSDCAKLAMYILARLDDPRSEVSRGKLTTSELASWTHWRLMRESDPTGRRIINLLESMIHGGWIYPILGSAARSTRGIYTRYAVNPMLRERFPEQVAMAVEQRRRWAEITAPTRAAMSAREPGED